jgi:hypothetical protein
VPKFVGYVTRVGVFVVDEAVMSTNGHVTIHGLFAHVACRVETVVTFDKEEVVVVLVCRLGQCFDSCFLVLVIVLKRAFASVNEVFFVGVLNCYWVEFIKGISHYCIIEYLVDTF